MDSTHKGATSGRGLRAAPGMNRDRGSRVCIAAAVLFLGTTCGCGGDGGPQRFDVSGDITFNGQPIPAGEILFTPDGAKGNSGPQGIATITAGKYDTRLGDGQGVAGGATVILVNGFSAPGGKLLCEYEYRVDLPKKDSTHKVEVPASAANKKPDTPEI